MLLARRRCHHWEKYKMALVAGVGSDVLHLLLALILSIQ